MRRVRRELDGWVLAPRVASRSQPRCARRYLAAAAAAVLASAGGALVLAKGEMRYPNGQIALRLAAPARKRRPSCGACCASRKPATRGVARAQSVLRRPAAPHRPTGPLLAESRRW